MIAAATGRTLVLPPPQIIYLLSKQRTFDDFFPVFSESFQKRVEVVTMEDFLIKELGPGGLLHLDDDITKQSLISVSKSCNSKMANSECCYRRFVEEIINRVSQQKTSSSMLQTLKALILAKKSTPTFATMHLLLN